MHDFFKTGIEYLKGVGPAKAELLKKEMSVFTFGDLLYQFPFRYEDRSVLHKIEDLYDGMDSAQLVLRYRNFELRGTGRKKRLVVQFADDTGSLEAVWFQRADWILKKLKPGLSYIVYGKPQFFKGGFSMNHPEFEPFTGKVKGGLIPVYYTTERLKRQYLDSRGISKIMLPLLEVAEKHISENLSSTLLQKYKFVGRREAIINIHFPKNQLMLKEAERRLKYEELFYVQYRLISELKHKKVTFKGQVFNQLIAVKTFYEKHLPFDLTGAQKRVVREVFEDLKSGSQMNRLLQGDVGSGKTVVAFICMLMAIDNGAQTCLMAPTEILAEQHFQGLKEFAELLGLKIEILTGSTKTTKRKEIHAGLLSGDINMIVGTHALLEDKVQFHNLGFAVIDEQHKFGVAQRAKLWGKNKKFPPHILIMSATPIPRTLAMTFYGDLDISVIDELPAGRKPIVTVHRNEGNRLRVFGFIEEQIKSGGQCYMVYPLIEESETLDLNFLTDGYEAVKRAFPEYHVSIVHGKMKPEDKEFEMQRFVKGETKIMVATTVIEVGVNVPKANVMVIESSERFGLSQLHQLRGRVGRSSKPGFCILMTGNKVSKEGRERIAAMVRTNNGFEIADIDMKLRGPGDIMGTQQSGILDLNIADLSQDSEMIKYARADAQDILNEDIDLNKPENLPIKIHLSKVNRKSINWSVIS